MTDEESFDEWVVQEGGPEAVVEMVSRLRRQIDDGTLLGFTGADAFLERTCLAGSTTSNTWSSKKVDPPA